MGKEQYISLIAKKLNNELNVAELRELNGWLSSNSENPELLSDFQHIWDSVSSYKAAETFDSSAAFSKFSQKYDLATQITSDVAKKSTSSIKTIIIALTAIALFLGGYMLSSRLTPTFSNDQMAALPVQLTDNASATLKPNTSLKFNANNLVVSSLDGGAYFNLEKQQVPLNFDLSKTKIMANAAKMNLQNYDGEDLIADVEKGSVTVEFNNKKEVVESGHKIIISKDNGSYSIIAGNSDNAFAWSNGVLSFDKTPLYEVFSTIEQFYGVTIEVTDDSNVSGHFTAINMQPRNLEEVLELLSTSRDMHIKQSGKDGRDIEISEISEIEKR